jgi:hypothetical protein
VRDAAGQSEEKADARPVAPAAPPRLSVRHLGRRPSTLSSSGGSSMKECGLSSKAPKSVLEKRRNAPKCWREHFASLAMR